jgi:6-phosphogluconolactonase/glucosamine-6-phosphate isomerase/deaminase
VKTVTENSADSLALSISTQLNSGKPVLFLVGGGSGIAVSVKVSEILEKNLNQKNLTIMPTDERYGPVGHPDSNWQQLTEKGFSLPDAKLIPVLRGEDTITTTQKFAQTLKEEFSKDSYKIGLFGIGADGHTAGILPGSDAVDSPDLAYTYKTPTFERITMTPKAILQLDEIVLYAEGKNKWKTLTELKQDKDIHEQPAQILKKVKKLKIFTDYN